jgi:predicted secreted protein
MTAERLSFFLIFNPVSTSPAAHSLTKWATVPAARRQPKRSRIASLVLRYGSN